MAAGTEPPAPTVRREPRTPAQVWCLLGGWTLVLVGLIGFLVNASFDTGHHVQGDDLIIFEVNGWHNLVHIASGLLLVAGIGSRPRARTMAMVFGLTYGVVTLIGWIDGHDVLGLFPVDTADNLLHTFLAAAAIVFALMSRPSYDERLHMTSPGAASGSTAAGPAASSRADRFRRGTRDRERTRRD
jgi:hypothetical protein